MTANTPKDPVAVETTAQACLRMAEDRAFSILPAVRCVLRLAHDELEARALPAPGGEALGSSAEGAERSGVDHIGEPANMIPENVEALREKVASGLRQKYFVDFDARMSVEDAADAILALKGQGL